MIPAFWDKEGEMLNFRTGFIAVCVFFALSAMNLHASDTRIAALGYKASFYIRDYNNVSLFPSAITNYGGLFFIESLANGQHAPSASSTVPGTGIWRGGVFIQIGERFTFGFMLDSRSENITESDTKFTGFNGLINRSSGVYDLLPLYNSGLASTEASHRFTLLGGLKMSAIDLGFSLTKHGSELTYSNPENSSLNFSDELSSSLFSIGISTKAGRRSRFEGSIIYHTGDFRHIIAARDTAQYKAPYGYNAYGVNFRIFYAFSKKTILVPFISYLSGSSGYTNLVKGTDKTDGVRSYKNVYSVYNAGLGFDIFPYEKTLLTIASGITGAFKSSETILSTGSADPASEYKYKALPFVSVGLEAHLTRWMGARFSFYELLEKMKVTNMFFTGDAVNMSESGFDAVFGLWFKLGRFTIDTVVDTKAVNDFLHNSMRILSGSENPVFTQMSITYNFK